MSYQVKWLPEAVKDLRRLRGFIHPKNPQAAKRAAKRILEGVDRLADNPLLGLSNEELLDYSEILVPFGAGNYILRYRIKAEQVYIVRIWHSREQRSS